MWKRQIITDAKGADQGLSGELFNKNSSEKKVRVAHNNLHSK